MASTGEDPPPAEEGEKEAQGGQDVSTAVQ